ncbi:MAG: hypothetical protein RL223_863 [Pseudomonadota bacterium]
MPHLSAVLALPLRRRPVLTARPWACPTLRGALARLSLMALVTLAGCAHPALREAENLAREGHAEAAWDLLQDAQRRAPDDAALRAAALAQRERLRTRLAAQAELALAGGRTATARERIERLQTVDPAHPRLPGLRALLTGLEGGEADGARGRPTAGTGATARHTAARPPASLGPAAAPLDSLGPAFQKPIALEFREAPLRQVFELLSRSSGVNFVFDKDVRGEAKVTVFLRNVSLDEALRVVLATQGLDRKLLNDSTVLVYPNTVAKQREHQELVTRSLYLRHGEAKALLGLLRTMTKTRDLYADERLNALVVRDTAAVVRQIESLVATLDLPEPEVLLAVEVLEVAASQVDELGLSWPETLQYGVPGVSGQVRLSDHASFRASVLNPALVATLKGDAGTTNLLANPTIRARNREKAKVQIGEKLPVFSTTSVVNAGVSTSVSYLDVGLKLEVEPTVSLDDEIVIKVGLDVSSLVREVSGPQGAIAYQVGSRTTSTALRLRDGETQVLAGLINDEDRQRAVGIPGMSRWPLLGGLFGVQGDTRKKTEVVMLITPTILRRLPAPDAAAATIASGTESLPGAGTLRLRSGARVGLAATRGAGSPPAAGPAGGATTATEPEAAAGGLTGTGEGTREGTGAAPAPARLLIRATERARVGDTVSVTLSNRSAGLVEGELVFDGQRLQPASRGTAAAMGEPPGGAVAGHTVAVATAESMAPGRIAFRLPPQAETAVVLRLLPEAAGQVLELTVAQLSSADGAAAPQVEGEARITVAGP